MDSQTIIDAIASRQWPIIVALVAMLVAAFAGDVAVRAGVEGLGLRIVSVVRAYIAGAGAAVIAGAVWWQALIAAAFAPIVSAGARDLAVDLVRWLLSRRAPATGAVLLLILPALSLSGGCAGWQEPGPAGACESETAIVDSLEAAYDAVAELGSVPAEVKAELADALRVGRALVDTCVAVRDREGWAAFVAIALRVAEVVAGWIHRARAKADMIEGLDPPEVPPALREVIGQLRLEVARG